MLSLQGANILLTERGDVKLGQCSDPHVDTQTHDYTPTLATVLPFMLLRQQVCCVGGTRSCSTVTSLCFLCPADFGVAAELSASVAKRKSFIGTPYW